MAGKLQRGHIIKAIENISAIIFLIAWWKYDLRIATLALMGWSSLLVLCARVLGVTLTKLQFYSWVVIISLGSITLLFDNDIYIKLKTTIIHFTLSSALLISHIYGKTTIIEKLFGEKIKAPKDKLRTLNVSVALYLLFIGSLNYYIATNFNEVIWMKFKYIGIAILHTLFIFGALYYLKDYMHDFLEKIKEEQE